MDKIKITRPDKPEQGGRMRHKYEFVGPLQKGGIAWPLDKYERQTAWKARNPDKVRAYHRQYMRDRRAANRQANFIIAKAK